MNTQKSDNSALTMFIAAREIVNELEWAVKIIRSGEYNTTSEKIREYADALAWIARFDELVKQFGEGLDDTDSTVFAALVGKEYAKECKAFWANNHLPSELDNFVKFKGVDGYIQKSMKPADFIKEACSIAALIRVIVRDIEHLYNRED